MHASHRRNSPHFPLAVCLLVAALAVLRAQEPAPPPAAPDLNDRLQEGLKRFPEADANHDGTLTMEEARAFMQQRRVGATARPAKGDGATGQPGAAATPPTLSDVAYGPHERNRLDFWRAKSDTPAPLVAFIHGGGFVAGDKASWRTSHQLAELHNTGFACAAINYPFRDSAPIQDILRHVARAVQFMRSKAGEWNIDKTRFAGWGGSAGAGSSLWLDTRDDLADPENPDPVLRESSRLQAAVLTGTQATYNLPRWDSIVGPPKPEWLKSPNELIEFYHFASAEKLESPEGRAVLDECDMLKWIGPGDGPLFIIVNQPGGPVTSRGHWLHHPKHAEEVRKACDAAGVPCSITQKDGASEGAVRFLEQRLAAKPAGS